jgi:hypothetical protein
MNYFKEYEKLKESKQLIHIGSIWEDYFWKVQIIEVTSASVYCMFHYVTLRYDKKTFLEKFTRVE